MSLWACCRSPKDAASSSISSSIIMGAIVVCSLTLNLVSEPCCWTRFNQSGLCWQGWSSPTEMSTPQSLPPSLTIKVSRVFWGFCERIDTVDVLKNNRGKSDRFPLQEGATWKDRNWRWKRSSLNRGFVARRTQRSSILRFCLNNFPNTALNQNLFLWMYLIVL